MLRIIYLILGIAGGFSTWYFNFRFMGTEQSDPWYNPILQFPLVSSFTADLFIGATAAVLFIIYEGKRLKMKYIPLFVVLTFTIAFACAFPLFLWYREGILNKQKGND